MISFVAGRIGLGASWQSSTFLLHLRRANSASSARLPSSFWTSSMMQLPTDSSAADATDGTPTTKSDGEHQPAHDRAHAHCVSLSQANLMRMKTTNPNRASASVKAMPRNMVVRTMPAASGWRAMAVMALPTTMPMPMPGPMAAPP